MFIVAEYASLSSSDARFILLVMLTQSELSRLMSTVSCAGLRCVIVIPVIHSGGSRGGSGGSLNPHPLDANHFLNIQ